jgi:hypothetical protein
MRALIPAILICGGLTYGSCTQSAANAPNQPSVGAQESEKAKTQEQSKTTVVADARANGHAESGPPPTPNRTLDASPSRLPDLLLQGGNNIDQVIASLVSLNQQRGPEEAEAALHRWYDKHDALLLDALQAMDGMKSGAPNGGEAGSGLHSVAISLRIQAAFLRVSGELPKLGLRPDWFKMHCSSVNWAPCRQDLVSAHP